MEKFVTRKKRKISPGPGHADDLSQGTRPGEVHPSSDDEDDSESTDVKLAVLSSLHPDLNQDLLLEFLLAHDGSVKAALQSLKTSMHPPLLDNKKSFRTRTMGAQTSLRAFAIPTTTAESEPGQSLPSPSPQKKKPRVLSRKGATLHLYDPQDISEHTPCTVMHNFLPEEEADGLLRELLDESKTFRKMTFKLFDNVVSSPHTSGFYVGTDYELNQQKSEYVYNGARMDDVRKLTPWLERVRPRVQDAVNREIQERIRTRYPGGRKLRHQAPGPWQPNAAFVNCYSGPEESVGWHSDQLTYLGPRAVIGSLSLGVSREFRVRRIVPKDEDTVAPDMIPNLKEENEGQIAIHLPHNSLLVMHAEMQEEWKHSIAPAPAIDPHPVAGSRRINVTYRHYREAFHPRHTPRCGCGTPAVLRIVQRRRENRGRYFWMCHAGNVPGKQGCSFFQWAEFDDDGVPLGVATRKARAGDGGGVVSDK